MSDTNKPKPVVVPEVVIIIGSTNVGRIAYLEETLTLQVAVGKPNGKAFEIKAVYQYQGVTTEKWAAFRRAKSKGSYFRSEIAGKYTHTAKFAPDAPEVWR